jgi:hypothetical protein
MQNMINKPAAIRKAFQFLIDEFGYLITRDEELRHENRPYAFVIEYTGNKRKIHLCHDYKENFFYFEIIKVNGWSLFNNKHSTIFWKLFRHFEPSIELKAIQPDGQSCEEAAMVNAQLLRKYASRVLCGEEWI